MVKPIKKITRKSATRQRKKLIVVGTEGKNQTEELYLREFEKKYTQYHFIFSTGNYTDPVQIVKDTIGRAKKESLHYKSGDLAVSIFDLDLNHSKETQLRKAQEIGRNNNVNIITSNPCFEIWFLEHFGFTSKSFNCNKELLKALKNYMPNYSKTEIQFEVLFPLTLDAIMNSRKLDKYHSRNSTIDNIDFCNPRTDMYKFVELLLD